MSATIEFSTKTVGFTSVAKFAFIHQAIDPTTLNYVPTEFKATEKAIECLERNGDLTQVAVCELDNKAIVMTAEESRTTKSPEIGLKLVNYIDTQTDDGVLREGGEWIRDDGYMTSGGYKNAMETLGYDARRSEGKPLLEWLELIEISESTHKKYTSGHAPISRGVAKLINALLREVQQQNTR